MTRFLIFYIILVLTIVLYLFIFLFNIYIYILLGGLPLYGVYDSFVDYPYDDVVYCH